MNTLLARTPSGPARQLVTSRNPKHPTRPNPARRARITRTTLLAAFLLVTGTATARTPRPTVFIGGTGARFATLADPAINRPLLATPAIGLYQHGNGMAALTPAQRAALLATWSARAVGEVGAFAPIDPAYLGYFGGTYPPEINMNAITGVGDGSGAYTAGAAEAHPGRAYTGHVTPRDLTAMKAAIDAARAAGARNVAVVITPNGGGEDLDDPFATAPFWANARAAARYGGGLAIDAPPTYLFLRGPAYERTVIQMLRFAQRNGLRASLIVSPYPTVAPDTTPGHPACGLEPTFMANTIRLVAHLKAAHALPSQWIVENYTATPTCNGNDIDPDPTPNSLDQVALYLARTTPPPTAR